MNDRRKPRILPPLPLLTLLAVLAAGCGGSGSPWGDPESGVILTYRMPAEGSLHYTVVYDQKHTLDVRGQERQFANGRTIDFSMAATDSPDENVRATVTLDAVTLMLDTPQGPNTVEAKKLESMSFDLTLSPTGRVLDSGEATELTYFLGGAGEQGIDNDFLHLFPELPDGPLRVGDTWTHMTSLPGKSFNPETTIDMQSVNTLEGFETIDGKECAKIASRFEGELVTEGQSSPGMAISGGPVTGTGMWYFAYKEGLLVRALKNVSARTEIAMGEPGSPPVPALEETKIEVGLADQGDDG